MNTEPDRASTPGAPATTDGRQPWETPTLQVLDIPTRTMGSGKPGLEAIDYSPS